MVRKSFFSFFNSRVPSFQPPKKGKKKAGALSEANIDFVDCAELVGSRERERRHLLLLLLVETRERSYQKGHIRTRVCEDY